MSIIHEALKKVQSERSGNTNAQNNPATTPKQSPSNSTTYSTILKTPLITNNSWSINKLLWSLLLFILLSFTLYNLYSYNVRITKIAATDSDILSVQSLVNQNTNSNHPPAITDPAARIPMPPQPKKGELILSGVVKMDGKNFALINNEFYETGETVEGAKITRITTDSVDILQKNKLRTIKILRPREP
ncbi:MAG: hypothetical protein H6753_02525 [Candidatus Omnitrophica bacterium]|nr:hypothetical protein [Candidatus Omnitrophota bacterium]